MGAAYFIPRSVIDFVTAVCHTMLSYGGGVVFGHAPLLLFVLYTLRTLIKYKVIWVSITQYDVSKSHVLIT